jgi:hypothetical protein
MNTLRRILDTDDDGIARVDVPAGAHRRIEVTVSWREVGPLPVGDEARGRKDAEPESLAGTLANDPLARPEQPVLESRLSLE